MVPFNRADFIYPEFNRSTIDAFARLRVGTPSTIFDSKQIVDNLPLFWDDVALSGTGTSSTYSQARASTTMGVSANTAGVRVRQTKRRWNYQPGKSQEVLMTFVLGAGASGVTKRCGLFDADNGVFLEQAGSELAMVIRSSVSGSPVDTRIVQSAWNIDRLDGTGQTGYVLDPTKAQILYIDYEWLGVGSVRFGFVIDGVPVFCHQQNNANNLASVYMSTSNVPLRYEIRASGTNGAATLEAICSSVTSNGGVDPLGVTRSIDRGATGLTSTTSTADTFPLVSIRLKTTHLGITVIPISLSILCGTTGSFRWALYVNPTVGGVDAASWTALANSAVEFDVTRNNTNVLTGGTVLVSGYAAAAQNEINLNLEPTLLLGATVAGVRDEIVLGVQILAAPAETFYGSLTFRELL